MLKTNVLGIGDLVLDKYYNQERKLILTSLGGSVFNSITLLEENRFNKHFTLYYGSDVGNKFDFHCSQSGISKESSVMLQQNNKTFNISLANADISDLDRYWYNISTLDTQKVLEYVASENIEIVVFDTLKNENIDIAKKLRSNGIYVFADISYICMIKKLCSSDLLTLLTGSFDFLQLSKEGYEYISDKLYQHGSDLVKLLNLKILSVTYETKNIFYTTDCKFEYSVKTYLEDPIDVTGAGDAFFSVFIDQLKENNYHYNENVFNIIMEKSNEKILPILQNIGINQKGVIL